MLLCAGSSSANSWYFHVAGQGVAECMGFYAYPKFMREAGYSRYLRENQKCEIRRVDVRISNPRAAYQKLVDLMQARWLWRVQQHNCATFVQEIVAAGGGNLRVFLNCPDQEVVRGLDLYPPGWSAGPPPPPTQDSLVRRGPGTRYY